MTDEMEALMARARQLEEANDLLRSMQPPSGGEADLRAENARLRNELKIAGSARPAAADEEPRPADPGAPGPATLAEFQALPPSRRQALAHRMTRQQRDVLLGRHGGQADRDNYL